MQCFRHRSLTPTLLGILASASRTPSRPHGSMPRLAYLEIKLALKPRHRCVRKEPRDVRAEGEFGNKGVLVRCAEDGVGARGLKNEISMGLRPLLVVLAGMLDKVWVWVLGEHLVCPFRRVRLRVDLGCILLIVVCRAAPPIAEQQECAAGNPG